MGSASTLNKMSDATPNTLAWATTTTQGPVFKPDGVTVTLFFPNASSRIYDTGGFTDNNGRVTVVTSTSVGSFHQIANDFWGATAMPYPWNLPRVRSNYPAYGGTVRCIKI
jgi:hypothetical protein